jgi:hypothetical protein
MLDVIRTTARVMRDFSDATNSAAVARAASAFAGMVHEPRWWRCTDPGRWSVQTIWICDESDADAPACPVQLLVEVVDRGECRVGSIEDWRPQPSEEPYVRRDTAFGQVLPGHGPVHVLAYSSPPFGEWEAA